MQIAARGGDVAVTKRRLHLGQRGPAVDGVRTVRVAQPVRRYSLVDAGLTGGTR